MLDDREVPTDVGQQVQELRSVLERSQALLADLEEQQQNKCVGESGSGPGFLTASGAIEVDDADDDDNEEAPENHSPPAPVAVAGIKMLKSKLTQWFGSRGSSRRAAKADTAVASAETSTRSLSFSRVNIQFQSETVSISLPNSGLSTSPQPAWRLQHSVTSARRGPQHQTPGGGAAAKRAVSFTAAGARSFTYSGGNGSGSGAPPALGPQPQIPDTCTASITAAMEVPRRASFDVRTNHTQPLVPTLLSAVSVSPPQRRRSILRDTVWSSSPDGPRPAAWAALQASTPSFRSHPGDEAAVPGVETASTPVTSASVPRVAAVAARARTEANVNASPPPLLPPLQLLVAPPKSTPHGYVCAATGSGSNTPGRAAPQPSPPHLQQQQQQASSPPHPALAPLSRSFTLGSQPAALAGRATATAAAATAPAQGLVGGRRHITTSSSWTDRGTYGRFAALEGNAVAEEGGRWEAGRVAEDGRQEEEEQAADQLLPQQPFRQHNLLVSVARLAGIPETLEPDRVGGPAARRPGARRSSDVLAPPLGGSGAVVGMEAGLAAAAGGYGGQVAATAAAVAARAAAMAATRSRSGRRQTWSNEVYVPVEA